MADLYDYIEWRGDLSFDEAPINEIDGMIFSLISYADLGEVLGDGESVEEEQAALSHAPTLLTVARRFFKNHQGEKIRLGLIIPASLLNILVKAAKSKRFGGCRVVEYVNHICSDTETQFSAETFILGNSEKDIFVAFRGTDDSIVGWKENFNMSYMHPVPAQLEAVEYVERIASLYRGRLTLGGHSKGGNLAIYAAARARRRVKNRINAVYNYDGPGFTSEFIESEGYRLVSPVIRTIVPESSIVGMLLEHGGRYEVVKSDASGAFQHNGMSWQVMGGRFVYADELSEESKRIYISLKEWLSATEPEQRQAFVDSVYEIISSGNIRTLTELSGEKLKIFKAWNALDSEARGLVMKFITLFFKSSPSKRTIKDKKGTEGKS